MKPKKIKDVPQWAVPYIECGDKSGLDEQDVSCVEEWLKYITEDGYELAGPVDGSENEFCSCPEFGLACSTVDYWAFKAKKNGKGKKGKEGG